MSLKHLSIFFVVLAFFSSQHSSAFEFDSATYDIYYGDFNGDGLDSDVYFKGDDKLILLHGEIIVPIQTQYNADFVFYEKSDGTHTSAVEYTASSSQLAAARQAHADTDFYWVDIDGDGIKDLFIRGRDEHDVAFILAGNTNTTIPSAADIMVEYAGDNALIHNLSDRDVSFTFSSHSGGTDIRITSADPSMGDVVYQANSEGYPAEFDYQPGSRALLDVQKGSTAGEFNVTEAGAATYSVPIALPDGVAGVKPSVGLAYSSQQGDGIAGYGWSVSAGASITRCRQTLYQDGKAMPMLLSETDRFCLNGQRLVLTNSTDTYGAPNTVYKTEIDNFQLIKSVGGTLGNPDHFIIIGKDGSLQRFGYNTQSKVAHTRNINISAFPDVNVDWMYGESGTITRTLTWKLTSSSDSVGNTVHYNYTGTAGDHRLDNIQYANGAVKVAFVYTDRVSEQYQRSYVLGTPFTSTKLLNKINVYNNNLELRSYHLDYQSSTAANLSYLKTVTECADVAGSDCRPALNFGWTWKENSGFYSQSQWSFSGSQSHQYVTRTTPYGPASFGDITLSDAKLASYRLADINGDGCSDIVYGLTKETDIYLNYLVSNEQCNGYSEGKFWGGNYDTVKFSNETDFAIDILDFNADGHLDVAVKVDSNKWDIMLAVPDYGSNTGNWKLSARAVFGNAEEQTYFESIEGHSFADVNSDGLPDLIEEKNKRLRVRYAQRETHFPDTSSTPYSFGESVEIGLLYEAEDAPKVNCLHGGQAGANFITPTIVQGGYAADFNSDGSVDIVSVTDVDYPCSPDSTVASSTKNFLSIHFQEGNTITQSIKNLAQVDSKDTVMIVDVNSDGLSDIIYDSNDVPHVLINNGIFFNAPIAINGLYLKPKEMPQVVDLNGDGNISLIWFDEKAKQRKIFNWNNVTQTFSAPVVSAYNDKDVEVYMDANGDGQPDKIVITNAKGSGNKTFTAYRNASGGLNRLITSISNGLGNVTAVSYESLSMTDHYTLPHYLNLSSATNNPFGLAANDPEYGHPVFWMNTPMAIVTRVESSAPIAGAPSNRSAIEYFYENGRIQAGGRGFLGFERVSTKDMQTDILSTTSYYQQFPYTGMPKETIKQTSDEQLLSKAVNTYKNARASWPNSQYYQPYLSESVEDVYNYYRNFNSPFVAFTSQLTSTVTTKMEQDSDGNVTEMETTTVGKGYNGQQDVTKVDKVFNTYDSGLSLTLHGETLSYKMLGRLTSTSKTGSRNGTHSSQKQVQFEYYTADALSGNGHYEKAGLLKKEITEPLACGYPDLTDRTACLITEHYYDQYGNKTRTEVSGSDGYNNDPSQFVTRAIEITYDAAGRYQVSSTNALGQILSEVVERDPRTGAATVVKTAAGVINRTVYDAFGRETFAISNLAPESFTTTDYLGCDNSPVVCSNRDKLIIQKKVNGGVTSRDFLDALGNSWLTTTTDFEGKWVYVTRTYDSLGRQITESSPYRSNGGSPAIFTTTTTFDILGRPTLITGPDGSETTMTYLAGNGVQTEDDLGRSKYEYTNGLGELVQVKDHDGNEIFYDYNDNSELALVRMKQAGASETVTMTTIGYNAQGRKTSMNDADKGNWQYAYNSFGELIRQTDAKGQKVENTYDVLGRLQTRIDYLANGSEGNTTRWYFDGKTDTNAATYPQAYGQTTAVIMSNSSAHQTCANSAQHCSYSEFDALGRPVKTTTKINTDNNDSTALEVFTSSITYDAATGRVDKTFDAMNGKVLDANDRVVQSGTQNNYNAYGFVESITDLATGMLVYKTQQVNDRGQVTEAMVGGFTRLLAYDNTTGRLTNQKATVAGLSFGQVQDIDYQWDTVGNLVYRHNRSTKVDASGYKDQKESFCYDGLNRLIKTNIGTTSTGACTGLSLGNQDVQYDGFGNISAKRENPDSALSAYSYGTRTSGTYSNSYAGPHAVTSANGQYYQYDANGNVTNDTSGRAFTYTTFDKPTLITKGAHSTAFAYGPGRNRYLRTDSNSGNSSKNKTTLYLGDIERIQNNDGTYEWKRHLKGSIQTYTTSQNGKVFEAVEDVRVNFIFKDHLGSVDVILDEQGNVKQNMSFNAWGARRHESNWSLANLNVTALGSFDSSVTTRGFTGHEMLDDVGVTHMNGRIYDAQLTRFLQADPFVQAAKDTQMYNRYSYTRNNPLNATDPSGYIMSKRGLVGAFTNGVAGELFAQTSPDARALVQSVGCAATAKVTAGFGCVAITMGNTYAAGGSTRDSLRAGAIAAISAAAFYGVSQAVQSASWAVDSANKAAWFNAGATTPLSASGFATLVAAQATVGGVLSKLQGGKFGHGFASAGVSKISGAALGGMNTISAGGIDIGQVIAAAVVGGTVSELTGGKFANGAVTAAFLNVFNQNGDKLGKSEENVKPDLLKGELEIELNDYIKGKLSSGSVELNVDLGAASISFDQTGKIAGTYGIVKGEGQLSGIGAKLTSLGVDIKGAQFTLSDFSSSSLSWKVHYSNSFWGYDVGKHFPSYSDSINIDAKYYVLNNSGLLGNAARSLRDRQQEIDSYLNNL